MLMVCEESAIINRIDVLLALTGHGLRFPGIRPRLASQAFRHATDSESLHNNGEDYNDIGHHQENTPFCFLRQG